MASNVDVIRGVYESFARGDVPGVLEALARNIRWTEAEGFPYAGTYTGPDAILENVFMRLGTEWDGYAAVPQEFVAQSDRVIALGHGETLDLGAIRIHAFPFNGEMPNVLAHSWNAYLLIGRESSIACTAARSCSSRIAARSRIAPAWCSHSKART